MNATRVPARQPSGWTVFTGMILLVVGSLNALYGLAAILNDEVVVVGGHGVIWADITLWGWIHFLLGLAVAGTGLMLFTGNPAARGLAIVFVAVNAVAQIVWFPAAPLWALMIVILDVILIYQLTVRWDDEVTTRAPV